MSDRYKALMEKSMQCIHLARTIQERHQDPTKVPAEDVIKRKKLLAEAQRLRELAAIEKQQADLDSWMAEPDRIPEALSAEAAVHKVGEDGTRFAECRSRRQQELFLKAMRQGWRGQAWIDQLETIEKANLIEDATGELLVPHDITSPIFKALPHLGIFRGSGPTVRPTASNKVDLRSIVGGTVGWGKLEQGATPPADALGATPAAVDVVEVHDLLARAIIGVDELADTDANLVALIQANTGQLIAEAEDNAFANGNGTSKPWGLAMRATQASPMITQGTTASAGNTVKATELKGLAYRVPSRFRMNGAYFASNEATEQIALLQDANSNFIWQPSIRAGEPDTLFGKRFYNLEGLPTLTAATADPSVLFGNPELGYLIADRQQISVQRLDEKYAEEGKVAFLFKMRVGGDIMRPLAWAKYIL